MNSVAYTTVMHWLRAGKVEGAVKHETPSDLWLLARLFAEKARAKKTGKGGAK
jgi:hypothetical protein